MRPDFDAAYKLFLTTLQKHGYSTELHWLCRESLRLYESKDSNQHRTVRSECLDPESTLEEIKSVYNYLQIFDYPIVFECLAHNESFTLCTLLGTDKGVNKALDIHQQQWNIWFCLCCPHQQFLEIEQIEDWSKRKSITTTIYPHPKK